MRFKDAKDTEGFLLRSIDPDTGEIFWFFRVYHGAAGNFTDYDIMHSDLEVKILSDDAEFDEQNNILDHNRRVLGRLDSGDGNGKTD